MRLIAKDNGTATQLFIADEIHPAKGMYLPELIRMVSERYGFAELPTVADTIKDGAKFKQGRLISGGNKINVSEMGVYNDGVIVRAFDTKDADYVLNDALAWLKDAFLINDPKTIIPRIFYSNVVVEFDGDVDDALKIFGSAGKLFQRAMKSTYKIDLPAPSLSSIEFGSGPELSPKGIQNPVFSITRRVGVPFSENRYYCSAPLTTDDHLDLLGEFDGSISKRKWLPGERCNGLLASPTSGQQFNLVSVPLP